VKVFISAAVGLVIGAVLGVLFGQIFMNVVFRTDEQSRDSQVITAIVREEQVVLLSLGIQGLHDRDSSAAFWGFDIPWSERTSLLEYSFTAKLGIEGGDVTIEPTGGDSYRISIPDFIFIGHQNENFRMRLEDHGVLSWVTPAIDSAELINEILNDDAKREYIDSNRWILVDQAEAFYRGIVTSIDPKIVLEFEFEN